MSGFQIVTPGAGEASGTRRARSWVFPASSPAWPEAAVLVADLDRGLPR